MKLEKNFYNKKTLNLAKDLLGKIIVRNIEGRSLRARIVETEAYTGENDKACHTYGAKRSPRTEIMYQEAGHIYVYLIYGLHSLVNIVSEKKGLGQAVLIRAVEPLNEFDQLSLNRFKKDYKLLSSYQKNNLTNGPGKLTKALKIDRNDNGKFLLENEIYLEDDGFKDFDIVVTTRIGIDYAQEAKDYPYRFYIKDNKYVSIK